MNKKVGLEMLSNAKAAESTLRREERRGLVEALPPGHPLEEEVKQAQAELDGDLSGLPEGHPLIRQLKAAQKRYEQAQPVAQVEGEESELDQPDERETAQQKAREVRLAKKISRTETRLKQARAEETASGEVRAAATAVNEDITVALGIVRKMYGTLEKNEGILNRHRVNAVKAVRLKRLLYAFERGVSDAIMSRV